MVRKEVKRMIRKNITMVHASKITSLGFPGCKTVQGVANFCKKNKCNYVWWKPNRNQKVLMVDPQSFRQIWKEIKTEPTYKKTQGRKVSYRRTTPKPKKQTWNRSWSRKKTARRRTY
jgi:hypothetical protein